MKTSHRESETGHTAVILEEIPVMFCDGLRCILKLKIAGKTLISSQRVAGPYHSSNEHDCIFLVICICTLLNYPDTIMLSFLRHHLYNF